MGRQGGLAFSDPDSKDPRTDRRRYEMNKRVFYVCAVAVAALLCNDLNAQQSGGRQGNQNNRRQVRPGQNAQAGQNQNGQPQARGNRGMDATEVAALMMQNYDADGNGSLDEQELVAALTALEQTMRQRQQRQGQAQGQRQQRGQGGPPGQGAQQQASGQRQLQGGGQRAQRGGRGGGGRRQGR